MKGDNFSKNIARLGNLKRHTHLLVPMVYTIERDGQDIVVCPGASYIFDKILKHVALKYTQLSNF